MEQKTTVHNKFKVGDRVRVISCMTTRKQFGFDNPSILDRNTYYTIIDIIHTSYVFWTDKIKDRHLCYTIDNADRNIYPEELLVKEE